MNLSDQVISLELAKRLEELGVKQESLFYYQNNPYNDGTECIDLMIKEWESENNENIIINTECENEDNPKYPVFTIAELLDKLPSALYGSSLQLMKGINFGENEPLYYGRYDMILMDFGCMETWPDKNPANALAKMLIYLIENGILKND